MATTQNQSSQHLSAARTLLDELASTTEGTGGEPQTKATMAVAHAVLVLAEQVAVVRVLMAGDAASKRPDLQAAVSPESQPGA